MESKTPILERAIRRVETMRRVVTISTNASIAFSVLSVFIMLFVFGLAYSSPLFFAMGSMLFVLICFIALGSIGNAIAQVSLQKKIENTAIGIFKIQKDGRSTKRANKTKRRS